jgi:hypothetical protein
MVALLVAGLSYTSAYAETSSAQLNRMKAIDLALAYESDVQLVNMMKLVEQGMNIVTPKGPISRSDAARKRKAAEQRLSIYRTEIDRRGTVKASGRYRLQITQPCTRVPCWLAFATEGATSVEIRQKGINVEILQRLPGSKHVNKMTGIMVGDSMVFRDSLNSDFIFSGVLAGNKFTIHPDPSVLKTWPKWAHPPKRSDIRSCTAYLTKR